MFHTFGRYKRSLLTVLGVLLASTLATASAATINMSQLTSNTAQPVVINSMPSNVDTTTPTLQADNNGQPILKVANTPVSTPIVGTPEKATINTSNSNYDGHLENFPSRKVTIVVPAKLRNENTAGGTTATASATAGGFCGRSATASTRSTTIAPNLAMVRSVCTRLPQRTPT